MKMNNVHGGHNKTDTVLVQLLSRKISHVFVTFLDCHIAG